MTDGPELRREAEATALPLEGRAALVELAWFGLFCLVVLSLAQEVSVDLLDSGEELSAPLVLMVSCMSCALTIPLMYWLERRRGGGFASLGLVRPNQPWWKILGWGVALGIGIKLASIPVGVVGYVLGLGGGMPEVVIGGGLGFAMLVTAGIVAAFEEELIFRGFFRTRFARAVDDSPPVGSLWVSGVASSVLFASGHVYQGSIGLVVTFVTGMLLFRVVVSSRFSLWHAIAAHASFNVIAFTFLAALG